MQDPIGKITNARKGYGCGSIGRGPAYQVRGPEFKLQYSKPVALRVYGSKEIAIEDDSVETQDQLRIYRVQRCTVDA
jgi:hypothetical protein